MAIARARRRAMTGAVTLPRRPLASSPTTTVGRVISIPLDGVTHLNSVKPRKFDAEFIDQGGAHLTMTKSDAGRLRPVGEYAAAPAEWASRHCFRDVAEGAAFTTLLSDDGGVDDR